MGVRGPIPKAPEARRRRNKAPVPAVIAPVSAKPPALCLPRAQKSTRDWWATMWASPMASRWLPADVPALRRLAVLVDLVARPMFEVRDGETYLLEVPANALSEMRQLEDRFGLSPLARMRLQWKIEDDQAAVEPPAPVVADKARFLRAVGS